MQIRASQMAQQIRQWSAGAQKDRIVVCRQLLAVKDGKDDAHDMSHVNDNDERSAAQMACSLSSPPNLDNSKIMDIFRPQ